MYRSYEVFISYEMIYFYYPALLLHSNGTVSPIFVRFAFSSIKDQIVIALIESDLDFFAVRYKLRVFNCSWNMYNTVVVSTKSRI